MQVEQEMINDSFIEHFLLCIRLRANDSSLIGCDAYRLFNGFYEGLPGLVIDRYANTLIISNHSRQPGSLQPAIDQIACFASTEIPGVESILLKTRHSPDPEERKGRLLYGQQLPAEVSERGVRYAIDLRLNQDDSFYPDTRNLRQWLAENSLGNSILNCFAYTGSLGIAALAGGSADLIQTDLNNESLAVAQRSYALNGFNQVMTLLKRDFFSAVNTLKNNDKLFDIVILDSPFFSTTRYGKVDLQQHSQLINKVRPLVAHEGHLIVINNALYVPGSQFLDQIDNLAKTGYATLENIIGIPADITGYPQTIKSQPPVDPTPFNHPTKICILKLLRKDQRPPNY